MQFNIIVLIFALLLALVSARIDPQNLRCLGVYILIGFMLFFDDLM